MRPQELNIPQLLEAVKRIESNLPFDSTQEVATSENQLKVVTFEGTILDALNTAGDYGVQTIGQLAIKTGIPATTLHSVIHRTDCVYEDAKTTIAKLSDTINSLSPQKAEAA